jgi:hypothetical protein
MSIQDSTAFQALLERKDKQIQELEEKTDVVMKTLIKREQENAELRDMLRKLESIASNKKPSQQQ